MRGFVCQIWITLNAVGQIPLMNALSTTVNLAIDRLAFSVPVCVAEVWAGILRTNAITAAQYQLNSFYS